MSVLTNTVGRAIAGFLRPSGNATGTRLYGDDPSCPSSASLLQGRSSKKDKSATNRQAHVTHLIWERLMVFIKTVQLRKGTRWGAEISESSISVTLTGIQLLSKRKQPREEETSLPKCLIFIVKR